MLPPPSLQEYLYGRMKKASTRAPKGRISFWLTAVLCAGSGLVARPAAADVVSATGKGITGGILLGAELGMLPQGILGVDKWWTYLLGGAVGAAGGGVAGYFVETGTSTAEPSLYMLAGGMALIIPTVVLTLNATAYKPEVEEGEIVSDESSSDGVEPAGDAPVDAAPGDSAPSPDPAASPADPAASPAAPAASPGDPAVAPAPHSKRTKTRRAPPVATALLGLDFSGPSWAIRPGIPAILVQPIYSASEIRHYGGAAGTQVLIPAVSGRF